MFFEKSRVERAGWMNAGISLMIWGLQDESIEPELSDINIHNTGTFEVRGIEFI